MLVKDVRQENRYPKLNTLLSILPDDAYLNADNEWHSQRLGMRLELTTEISTEILEDAEKSGSLTWLVNDWYRKLHEQLIQSEINWNKKLQLNAKVVPDTTPRLPVS